MKILEIVKELIEAKKSATFKNADFTDELKEQTRLYRQTWIIGPIDRAIFLIGHECGKRSLKHGLPEDLVFWDGYKAAKDGRGTWQR